MDSSLDPRRGLTRRHRPVESRLLGTGTSESEGGPRKQTRSKARHRPQPDPYLLALLEGIYLAVVVDAFGREVTGWAMAHQLPTELVLDAVGMAITIRESSAGRGAPHRPRSRAVHVLRVGKALRRS
jgi:transposase InsO family protein